MIKYSQMNGDQCPCITKQRIGLQNLILHEIHPMKKYWFPVLIFEDIEVENDPWKLIDDNYTKHVA